VIEGDSIPLASNPGNDTIYELAFALGPTFKIYPVGVAGSTTPSILSRYSTAGPGAVFNSGARHTICIEESGTNDLDPAGSLQSTPAQVLADLTTFWSQVVSTGYSHRLQCTLGNCSLFNTPASVAAWQELNAGIWSNETAWGLTGLIRWDQSQFILAGGNNSGDGIHPLPPNGPCFVAGMLAQAIFSAIEN